MSTARITGVDYAATGQTQGASTMYDLMNADTAEKIRTATINELVASALQARKDHGPGIITITVEHVWLTTTAGGINQRIATVEPDTDLDDLLADQGNGYGVGPDDTDDLYLETETAELRAYVIGDVTVYDTNTGEHVDLLDLDPTELAARQDTARQAGDLLTVEMIDAINENR